MSVFLHGLRLKNYRGIGNDFVELAPLKKMNFLIGKNNSGKSIFLDFIDQYVAKDQTYFFKKSIFTEIQASPTESHGLDTKKTCEIEFCTPYETYFEAMRQAFYNKPYSGFNYDKLLEKLSNNLNSSGYYWQSVKSGLNGTLTLGPRNAQVESLIEENNNIDWRNLILHHFAAPENGIFTRPEYLLENMIHLVPKGIEKVTKISTIRDSRSHNGTQIGDTLPVFSKEYLVNIIHTLAKADFNERNHKTIYRKLNKSLSDVLGDEEISVNSSRDGSKIVIAKGEFELPLLNVGKGIEDVLVILTASVCYSNQVICIEEPELNLHPLIQRRLIKFLSEHTGNQYIISTHSPTIIDAAEGSVFEVTHDGIQTRLRYVELDAEKRAICDDLGYKASDLLQSNCVIWVEGPSDKILINHWISLLDTDLVEGIHYSIMFYGGRLLSHLTAEWDKALSDFIELRRINANTAIIMDSDKKSEPEAVNETKKRIEDELSKEKNSFCWITAGREIENYMDFQRFIEIAKDIHPRKEVVHDSSGDFDDWYKDKDLDKVKIARRYAETNTSLERLDLNEKIEGLVQFIKKSNLME